MKKNELSKLITRKKILKESLDIINEVRSGMDEVGGFDSPELMSQYHGNYFDDLTKLFNHFDELSDPLMTYMAQSTIGNDMSDSKKILEHYYNFMSSYVNYLEKLSSKKVMKVNKKPFDGQGSGFSMNENKR